MFIARKTLDAIAREIKIDQGARWRGLLRKCMADLEDAYSEKNDLFRSHLGASVVGKACARSLWYTFRWATASTFEGRMLRLFNRGHLEEGRIVASLQLIGVQVAQFDSNGKQYRISGSHGHYGGSGDGMGVSIPDLPAGVWAILEFKTHNDKSWQELSSKGVRVAKYEHWAQMQQYMRKFGIRYSLYIGVNKNDDMLHAEIVELDEASADVLIDRADKIIWMDKAPPKIGNPPSAGLFGCRFCDHRPVCHLGAEPHRNCRSCVFSEPREGGHGVWFCRHWEQVIPKESLVAGCGNWTKHPDMGK